MRLSTKLTIDEIAERLAVSRTTVFYWVKDIPIPETRRQSAARQRASDANRDQARRKREAAYEEGVAMYPELIKQPTFRDFICMYIGEGTKKGRHNVSLCNSDPAVVKLAQYWITRMTARRVTYWIQYHADQEPAELNRFWSAYLSIEPDEVAFQRKSNSKQLVGRNWRSEHGVLTVRSSDTYFKCRLMAWIDLLKSDWQ
jgi:AcrR family transcriptional regulator